VNSSETKTLIDDEYQYKILNDILSEKELEIYRNSICQNFSKISWDDEKYSEWLIRNYLSIKMILSSSVMLTSCEASIDNNIRIVEPYLYYYSMLNCCRAYLFTHPCMEWKNGELINELTHEKIINCTSSYLSVANKNIAENFKNRISFLRYYRELFSYRFPADGLKSINKNMELSDVIENCQLLSDLAQYNSFLLHKSFIKKNKDISFSFKEEYMDMGYIYEGKHKEKIIDEEDLYRLDYIRRKYNEIYSLYNTMTEGMIEDFFGAWFSDEVNDSGYNPDKNWSIIFHVP
jgi:hypothetical protein